MANPYPSPKKTPKKSKSNYTNSKKRKSSTKLSRKSKRSRKAKLYKRYFKKSKPINVAADREGNTRSYKKQKVTRSQQRIINKKFKNGYSPFINRVVNTLQLTQDIPNKAKWIWRTGNAINLIKFAFSKFPSEASVTGNSLAPTTSQYIMSQNQTIYFGQIKYTYEIRNPCNYDLNLVIYDIVYKCDTDNEVSNNQIETKAEATALTGIPDDPISLISRGMYQVLGHNIPSATTNTVIVADPSNIPVTSSEVDKQNVSVKPTDSYPFNIYCKIIKKHTYRLQPGATMKHTFTHKPKAMLTRGYLGYKYRQYFSGTETGATDVDIGIKDFTSGCLFKVWGQVLNSGTDTTASTPNNRDLVTLGSGNIALYETIESKWYTMDNKYSYIFTGDNSWNPTEVQYGQLENPTDVTIKLVEDVN